MKSSKLPWLFFLIYGVCHFSTEADDDIDDDYYTYNNEYKLHGTLSLPYNTRTGLIPLPVSSTDYLSDQSDPEMEKSFGQLLKKAIQQTKNSSSRVKAGRKKLRKFNQSTTNHPTGGRRKPSKHPRVHQKNRYKIKSKDLDFLPGFGRFAQRSCPTKYNWLALKEAVNIDNDLVEIYQPDIHSIDGLEHFSQTFYTESCFNEAGYRDCPGCCKGIDHTLYTSSCKQRLSYVQALVVLPGSTEFFWSHIKINSSCVCEFALDVP